MTASRTTPAPRLTARLRLEPLEHRATPDAAPTAPPTELKPADTAPVLLPAADNVVQTTAAKTLTPAPTGGVTNIPTPPARPATRLAVGTGAGTAAKVNVYDAKTGDLLKTLSPFGAWFKGGVSVTAGDFTGDGIDDVAVGAAAGGHPHVKVYDGKTFAEIGNFFAFDASFKGGVNLAAGDVTGDGRADLVVGAGPNGPPRVKVFSGIARGKTAAVAADFLAYDAAYTGGVRVAAGNVGDYRYRTMSADGKPAPLDTQAEVITAPMSGPGSDGLVKVFHTARIAGTTGTQTPAAASSFKPFGTTTAGLTVAAGDCNGDGWADLCVGAADRPGLRVFRNGHEGGLIANLPSAGNAAIAMRDLDGDGRAEVVAVAGSKVTVYSGMTGTPTREFTPFGPEHTGSVVIA